MIVRPARWPDDEAPLAAIDTSFTTDRVYRVVQDGLAFGLVEARVDPPLRKSYGSLGDEFGRLRRVSQVVVAEAGGALLGMAAADLSTWNRRVQVEAFFVAPPARGLGIGRALMESVTAYARRVNARCVWLETQNVNYPAVRFYRRAGFRLCGLDDRLYDPTRLPHPEQDEVALFFALDITD